MGDIKLNFINRSADTNNTNIVIFQKNTAENSGEIAIAWKVITNCGMFDNHPFMFSMQLEVSGSGSNGKDTPRLTVSNGNVFEMDQDYSGNQLKLSSSNEVSIKNNMVIGKMNASCYRDGRLLAAKTGLGSGEKAVFKFLPKIYIGVVSEVKQGDVMNSAIVSKISTEINLSGITSADIVMTGGGVSKSATPFSFTLENINK